MGSSTDTNLMDALLPFIFMLPAFAIAIGSYFYYRKNGYVPDKIVDEKNKWLYRKVGAKRLGKKWVAVSLVIAVIFLLMSGITFFVDNFALNHFVLFVVSPIMMAIFFFYMIVLISMNRKKDDEEERG